MYNSATRISEKCIACYPRIEGKDPVLSKDNSPLETRCMTACVGKIRLQGLVKKTADGQWAKEPDNPINFLVREREIALPLYPQFGTEPNGYYIPPRWVPRGYLRQMFGPGVEHAIEQYASPDRELLAVLQLFRAAQKVIFKFRIEKGKKVSEIENTLPSGKKVVQEIFNDTVIGYGQRGGEIVRITVEEPTFERPKIHVNSI
jgi:nitrate reductase beta subunit